MYTDYNVGNNLLLKQPGMTADYHRVQRSLLGKMDHDQKLALRVCHMLLLHFSYYQKILTLSEADKLTLLTDAYVIIEASTNNTDLKADLEALINAA